MSTIWLTGRLRKFLTETRPVMACFTDADLTAQPVPGVRSVGDLMLHLVRSIPFYTNGIVTDTWAPLPYDLTTYPTVAAILDLYDRVGQTVLQTLQDLPDETWQEETAPFGTPGTRADLLLELIEHGIHHRGQFYTYARLLGTTPPALPYIV